MENWTDKLKPVDQDSEAIVLLHGLARTHRSMDKAAGYFARYGYKIINVSYPSRSKPIGFLAMDSLAGALAQSNISRFKKIHFFTHSLGGIVLRYYLAQHRIENLGRTVMLAPPNQGSEIVDKLGHLKLFYLLNGPAGLQLGTEETSVPNALGAVDYDVGVIAGDKSINLLLSLLFPEANDGKVAVSRTKVQGMKDFIVMPHTHTFIMQRQSVINQALHFIQSGAFAR